MQTIDLDLRHDSEGFLAQIQQKTRLLADGHRAGMEAAVPELEADGLLFAGMGGSGATAHLVRDACTRAIDHPFSIVQHYQIPRHVKRGWHTLALSYSGTTEETLSVVQAAKERGIPVTAFTTGGTLQSEADRTILQPKGFQPRIALGHSWFSVLGFLEGSGILRDRTPVEQAMAAVEQVDAECGIDVPEPDNPAKRLARALIKPIPQIYATPALLGTAIFLRCQLNENAKKIAGVELIPECNHNDLMGWGGDPNRDQFAVIVLSHAEQNPEIMERIAFMSERYQGWGVPWHHLEFDPVHSFAEHVVQQARAIQMSDYVSFYLAMMRGVDPAEIGDIRALKKRLRGH